MCVLTDLNVMCMLLQFPVRCWMCSGKFWTPAQYVCLGRNHSTPMAWSSIMRYHLFGALLEHQKVCALLLCLIPSWALRLVGRTHIKSVRKFCLPDCVMSCDLERVLVLCDDSVCIQGRSRFWPLVASLLTMQMQFRSQSIRVWTKWHCWTSFFGGTTSFVPPSVTFPPPGQCHLSPRQCHLSPRQWHLSPCQCHFTNSAYSFVCHRCYIYNISNWPT